MLLNCDMYICKLKGCIIYRYISNSVQFKVIVSQIGLRILGERKSIGSGFIAVEKERDKDVSQEKRSNYSIKNKCINKTNPTY